MAERNYSITTDFDPDADITEKSELREWAHHTAERYEQHLQNVEGDTSWFDSSKIDGVRYVADSLEYDSTAGAIVQNHTAPNYFGGLWSLATCKHHMRGHGKRGFNFPNKFKVVDSERGLYRPTRPVFVFTYTSKSGYRSERKQWLASVALVTHGFMSMSDYAKHLLEECPDKQSRYRLTRVEEASRPPDALAHGDCHANADGDTGGPPQGHDHHSGTKNRCGCSSPIDELHKDNDKDHMRCISTTSFWYAWDTPRFWQGKNVRQGYIDNAVPENTFELGDGVPVGEIEL